VMNLSEWVPWKLWATKADIRTLSDLKDRSVGIQTRGDLFEMSMRSALLDAGMDPGAVRYAQLGFGSAARIAAIQQALLPAVMLTNLEERILRERDAVGGAHVLINLTRTIRAPNNRLAVSDELLASNPSLVERILRGTLMAVEFIRMRRAGALRVMQAHAPDLSLDVLGGALDETAAGYLRNGMASESAWESELAIRGSIVGMAPDKVPPVIAVVDYSLVKQASQRLTADGWQPTR
jgi:ABC-type nitrate/sulfonate/bicarbonate transport system substrate-binding protein